MIPLFIKEELTSMENNELIFKGVTADSQKVRPGYMFVAIRGEEQDGNKFVHQAIKNGASLIVSEKALENISTPKIQVKDARRTLINMSALFHEVPENRINAIGVTGTNGKTTTARMIHKIFKEATKDIVLIQDKKITSPLSGKIYKDLYNANQRGIQWAVMEVSSHSLKQQRVEGNPFDTAIFTNIFYDHLSYHKNFEDYFSSKKLLFQGLQENKRAIINGDDPWALKLLEEKKNIYIITYGLNSKSTITASSIDIGEKIYFNYCLQRSLDSYQNNTIEVQEFPIEINVLGYHNIYNALAAITTALIYDIDVETIQRALKKFTPVHRRLEYVEIPPYSVLDDYAHNPNSLENAFQTLQTIDYKKINVVISIRGNRGIEINEKNAEIIANWCLLLQIKNIYITESEEFVEENDKVDPLERQAFLKVLEERSVPYQFNPSLEKSIKELLSRIEKEDLIMLLGAQGMDQGQNIIKKLIK